VSPETPLPVPDRFLRRVLAFFLLISVILIAVALFAVRNISRSVATSDWVNHTHEAILEAQALRSSLHVGDAALRTYLLIGEARDQATAREAFSEMLEHLEILRALLKDDAAARPELAEITRLTTARSDLASALMQRRGAPGETPASLVAADIAASATTDITRRLDRIKSQQMTLLAERDTASYLQAQTTRWTVWAGVILDFLLLAGVVWLIRDDLEARRRVVTTLESANRDLDAKVRERTAELVTSNEQLSIENLERRWANQALEHQHRYDELIINSINDLVLVLTKVLNISRLNPAVLERTGFSASELINKPLASLVELADDPGASRVAHALKTGHELRATGRVQCKAGGSLPVKVAVYPLRDGDKVVGGVVTLELVTADRN
jgi:PAS domain S-box-containing protein